MANNTRVLNVTRGYTLKHKQAVRAIEECASAWVEYGVSIRNLSLAESIAARNAQSSTREPLAFAELPGVIYQPAERNQAATRKGYLLIQQANAFAATYSNGCPMLETV